MVKNLRYGGATDSCAGNTTFNGDTHSSGNNWGYGRCFDPTASGLAPCNTTEKLCGYYYNWQAVVQNSGAYHNGTAAPATAGTQGICPSGWHVPTGGSSTGEFYALHTANASPSTGFWQGDKWLGSLSGGCGNTGSLGGQDLYGYFWSSSPYSATLAWTMWFTSSAVNPSYYSHGRGSGFAVRCVKN
jgi:hypothetical protein